MLSKSFSRTSRSIRSSLTSLKSFKPCIYPSFNFLNSFNNSLFNQNKNFIHTPKNDSDIISEVHEEGIHTISESLKYKESTITSYLDQLLNTHPKLTNKILDILESESHVTNDDIKQLHQFSDKNIVNTQQS